MPVNRNTGEQYARSNGYLDEALVPESVHRSTTAIWKKLAIGRSQPSTVIGEGQPPSQWLRSLDANELRLWLRTLRLPEFGVENMTFWTHLSRDHAFSPKRIRGLTIEEQAKLHSAAHYGF